MFTKKIASALITTVVASIALSSAITPASAGSYGSKNSYNSGGYNEGHGDNWGKHVRWCYNRYKSYREYDNTYHPYSGDRRACHSPYWRG